MLLPSLMEAFSLTQAQGGLIATLFAVVYACGQLVVGLVVDRVNPRACILSGLVIASAANFGCSLAPSYEWILALWTLNAVGSIHAVDARGAHPGADVSGCGARTRRVSSFR